VFRAQFHTMCANIGVDPLASNKVRRLALVGLGLLFVNLRWWAWGCWLSTHS
jgi:ESCRT-II complex subunit VPS22